MPHDDALALIDRGRDEFGAMRYAVALARLMSAELEAGSTDILRRIDDVIDCQRQMSGPRDPLDRALKVARKTVVDAVTEGDVDRVARAIATLRPFVEAFFARECRH